MKSAMKYSERRKWISYNLVLLAQEFQYSKYNQMINLQQLQSTLVVD